MNHNETKILPFTPAQMFALVMDVERYSEFLPWCAGCRIISRKENELLADMTVGYKFFREAFRTRVRFVQDKEIHVEYLDGPLKHLKNDWFFKAATARELPQSAKTKNACQIDFHIEFEFRNRLLQTLAESFFNRALGRMMDAFEDRAMQRFPQK